MLRLDHEGHQTGHSRGASSKADDVDLVYHLKEVDGNGPTTGHESHKDFLCTANNGILSPD